MIKYDDRGVASLSQPLFINLMPKQRLTITLSQSTLNSLDQLIDGKKIRSRSHAIESILQSQLAPALTTAVILAGGKMKTKASFKPLHHYQGAPIINHLIELLQKHGVSDIIVLTNQLGSELLKHLDQDYPEIRIRIKPEKNDLGTAGALKTLASTLTDSFYCLHSDIYTTIDLQEMVRFHQLNQGVATIAVKPKMSHQAFDNVSLQGIQVKTFQPTGKDVDVSLVNSGIYIFEPSIFSRIPSTPPSMLEKEVFPNLAKLGLLFAFSFQGEWLDVFTEKIINK